MGWLARALVALFAATAARHPAGIAPHSAYGAPAASGSLSRATLLRELRRLPIIPVHSASVQPRKDGEQLRQHTNATGQAAAGSDGEGNRSGGVQWVALEELRPAAKAHGGQPSVHAAEHGAGHGAGPSGDCCCVFLPLPERAAACQGGWTEVQGEAEDIHKDGRATVALLDRCGVSLTKLASAAAASAAPSGGSPCLYFVDPGFLHHASPSDSRTQAGGSGALDEQQRAVLLAGLKVGLAC